MIISIDAAEAYIKSTAKILFDPKNSVKRPDNGRIISAYGVPPIPYYLIMTAVLVLIQFLSFTQGQWNYKFAFSFLGYTYARIAIASILIWATFYVFDRESSIEALYANLYVTAAVSIPLAILTVVAVGPSGGSAAIYKCASGVNEIEEISVSGNIIFYSAVMSLAATVFYFSMIMKSLRGSSNKFLMPYLFYIFIIYPLSRPYIVEPMSDFLCKSIL